MLKTRTEASSTPMLKTATQRSSTPMLETQLRDITDARSAAGPDVAVTEPSHIHIPRPSRLSALASAHRPVGQPLLSADGVVRSASTQGSTPVRARSST